MKMVRTVPDQHLHVNLARACNLNTNIISSCSLIYFPGGQIIHRSRLSLRGSCPLGGHRQRVFLSEPQAISSGQPRQHQVLQLQADAAIPHFSEPVRRGFHRSALRVHHQRRGHARGRQNHEHNHESDGKVWQSDGKVWQSDGKVWQSDGKVWQSDGKVWQSGKYISWVGKGWSYCHCVHMYVG